MFFSMQPTIELKGSTFTLSVIYLYNDNLKEIEKALLEKMAQAPAFLKYAPIVINVSQLEKFDDWSNLKNIIQQTGFFLVGISGSKDIGQKAAIHEAGIATLNEGKLPEAVVSSKQQEQSAVQEQPSDQHAQEQQSSATQNSQKTTIHRTKIISTPVRSGQQIYARNTDLVVLNNVGAGAEIIADGNIHVYGIMRGKALAGASGDESAQIFCQQLEAEVISIAGNYWLSEQIPKQFFGHPSHISFKDGEITIKELS